MRATDHSQTAPGEHLSPRVPDRYTRLIVQLGRVAPKAAERAYYASHIEVLEPDHPERHLLGAAPRQPLRRHRPRRSAYDQGAAEAFARALLMPPEAFAVSGLVAAARAWSA